MVLKKIGYSILWLVFACCSALAQDSKLITLQNPSFEDTPTASKVPTGWTDCPSAKDQTAPDIQPGFLAVTKAASHGKTYVSLVVREDETWEALGQKLSAPLVKDQCYEFSLDMCRSLTYKSTIKGQQGVVKDFITPIRLIIWGGNTPCDKGEVLHETSVVTTTRWLKTDFRFHPKKGNWSHIIFEAYYQTPIVYLCNGNLLLDNCSAIKTIACNPEEMPDMPTKVVAKEPIKDKPVVKPVPVKPDTPAVKKNPQPQPVVETKIEKTFKVKKTYRLEKVYFDADKYEIKSEAEPELAELYNFLSKNTDITIEVGGHTNNNLYPDDKKAVELSTNRAKAVANWLTSRGISSERVLYKGYGYTQPVMPNTTAEGKKKNQRVEVKVLKSNE